jgi:GTP 3',8-cyclase
MIRMIDRIGRKIDYLRISITDRCNLRCQYCMPPEGVKFKPHDDIIRYEEIIRVVKVAVELGINKVRITGGEPLVRKGIIDFIAQLNEVTGLEDIGMTTNGTLLAPVAGLLQQAGLNRVNISLDSLKRNRYREITRRDNLDQVLAGIESALKNDLTPLKLNMVVMKGINDDEIFDFVDLTLNQPLHIRFIEVMPLGNNGFLQKENYISLAEIKARIEEKKELIPVKIKGNGPARYYQLPSAQGSIGFITPISHDFCATCNRLRLTADGRLRPCLASDLEVDLHDESGQIENQENIRRCFNEAVALKPSGHHFYQDNSFSERNMFQIGG